MNKLQSDVLRLLAGQRNPDCLAPRYSTDRDIFQDRADRLAEVALSDAKILADGGYQVHWTHRQPASYCAAVGLGTDETKIEWIVDSDYRFFPVVRDDQFGYVLHIVDLAINKVMAAASRRNPRDIVDLLTLHDRVLPIGALVWAAVEIAPGYTPEGLIAEVRRSARYPADELRQLAADPPIDPDAVMRRLRAALDEAEQFVVAMPSDKAGLLFLQAGEPVQPDPTTLDAYATHAPQPLAIEPGRYSRHASLSAARAIAAGGGVMARPRTRFA